MAHVRLIHWNEEEAIGKRDRLLEWGHEVDPIEIGPDSFRSMRAHPPEAVVIDLNRLPSHGRDVGVWVRETKATRQIPIIFVDGLPEKIERVKQTLPDATYTTWSKLKQSIPRAIKSARQSTKPVVVPAHQLSGYSGTPLPKKLGIKPESKLMLVGAPADFDQTLGELPERVVTTRQPRGKCDLLIWFPKDTAELEKKVDSMSSKIRKGGGIWIAWPKKASGVSTDLTQAIVRRVGLASGLVDYKICSIDATYSGLKFSHRKPS